MSTDLFLTASRLDVSALARVVPPSCLREVQTADAWHHEGDDAVLECGPWAPRRPAVHLLPAFAPLAPEPPAFRFELSVRVDGVWCPWVGTVTLGPADFQRLPTAAGPLTAETDQLTVTRAPDAVRLRVRCRGPLPDAWLASLSAAAEAGADFGAPPGAGTAVSVPPLSQVVEDPVIAMRICSPTSVAMVLCYWGRPATAAAVAADVFHADTDQYGIWPAAIRAAAVRGVAGYLLRFPDWTAAAWCLGRGIPIIASIKYAAGELRGAPMEATTGHLVVLTGYENGLVLVNDPAAPTADSVPRRYRRDELSRSWLARGGIGYVLFDPARA
jgi:peptidase C39-like protein